MLSERTACHFSLSVTRELFYGPSHVMFVDVWLIFGYHRIILRGRYINSQNNCLRSSFMSSVLNKYQNICKISVKCQCIKITGVVKASTMLFSSHPKYLWNISAQFSLTPNWLNWSREKMWSKMTIPESFPI